MISHIKNIPVPKKSTPYVPSQFREVPATGETDLVFTGRGGQTFGFDRILPGGSNLNDITASARLNDDMILFEDIKLSVLRNHFGTKSLLAPYIIQEQNDLIITLKNPTATAQKIGIQLLGYDAPYLARLINAYEKQGMDIPKPVFLHASEEIGANAQSQSVSIRTKAVDLRMLRATVKTDSDEDIVLSVQVYNESVKNSVFVQQFNDEYESNYANVPFIIGKTVPLSLLVRNLSGDAHNLSFLGETYVMKPGE